MTWTVYVCDEGHVNGELWDVGCESCYRLTRPVEVAPALSAEEADELMAVVRHYAREHGFPPNFHYAVVQSALVKLSDGVHRGGLGS